MPMFVGLASDGMQRISTEWNRWDGVGGILIFLHHSMHANTSKFPTNKGISNPEYQEMIFAHSILAPRAYI